MDFPYYNLQKRVDAHLSQFTYGSLEKEIFLSRTQKKYLVHSERKLSFEIKQNNKHTRPAVLTGPHFISV